MDSNSPSADGDTADGVNHATGLGK
jgi:hypothetical protein